ncbi:hypothetical protein [Geoalkalibacter halelectricus]|uniref:hypothetical protein n=1 Tax=Geoalkalibacter halelectricus TaxID=2847045 RepID=UPI003D251F5F
MTQPKYTLPITVHLKNVAELQVSYSPPRQELVDGRIKSKEGAVYLEMARPIAKENGGDGDRMDWRNKLIFKLSARELSVLQTLYCRGIFPIKRIHNGNAGPANLWIEQGLPVKSGDMAGLMTYRWTLKRANASVSIYLDEAHMDEIFNCFRQIQPALRGWVWYDTVQLFTEQQASFTAGARERVGMPPSPQAMENRYWEMEEDCDERPGDTPSWAQWR